VDSKIKEKINDFFKCDKKIKIFVVIGIVSIFVILLSEFIPSETKDNTLNDDSESYSYSEYIESLEKETTDIVGSIDGVGECKVMLTLKNTNESVYAKNSDESSDDGSYSKKYEYVLYDGQDGETPVLVKQYFPQIQGAVVVCEGGDNTVVKERVISAISSLFNISTSKISVTKISQ
jgi:stage III sporulation protein AG